MIECCNPCERRSIESKSVSWCSECEEGLCDRCLQDHKAMKMTQYHHVVKITSQDLVDNYHLLSVPTCERHPELKEDLLCKDHDVVCCNGCLVTEHKMCRNVVPLDDTAKGVKRSELFQAIKGDIIANKNLIKNIMEERHASMEELKRHEQRIKKEIANVKSKFIEHINNLEKSLLSELAAIPKENDAEIKKERRKIEQIEKEIEADHNAFTFVADNGSESQIFSFLHNLNKRQFKIKKKLDEIPPTSRVTITLEEASHEIEDIESLGVLSVCYDSVTMNSREKTYQSGLLTRQKGMEIWPQLKVEKEMEIDPKHFLKQEKTYDDLALFVNDFGVNEDNELFVVGNIVTVNKQTNYESDVQLVKYDADMKFVKSYNVESSNYFLDQCCNTMTCVPKSQQVVISNKQRLQFVNSKTMEKMWPSICLEDSNTIDMTASTMNIFVLQESMDIQVYDLIGRKVNRISLCVNYRYNTSIILQPNGNFLSKSADGFLASFTPDGSEIFSYCQQLKNVTVDHHGNIYMVVEDGIDVMHPHKQQVQKVFTCIPDTAKQVLGIETYTDFGKVCILHRKGNTNTRQFGGKSKGFNGHSVYNYSYVLQVLSPTK